MIFLQFWTHTKILFFNNFIFSHLLKLFAAFKYDFIESEYDMYYYAKFGDQCRRNNWIMFYIYFLCFYFSPSFLCFAILKNIFMFLYLYIFTFSCFYIFRFVHLANNQGGLTFFLLLFILLFGRNGVYCPILKIQVSKLV